MEEGNFPGTIHVESSVADIGPLDALDVSLLSDRKHAGVRISWNHKHSIAFSMREENMTTIRVLSKFINQLLKDYECQFQ